MFRGVKLSGFIGRGIAVAGLCVPLTLVIAGCTVEVQPVGVAYVPPAPPPPAQVDVSVEPYQPAPPEVDVVYHQDLDPYGHWVVVAGYGNCWIPNDRPSGWQPYTVGHWVETDQGNCWQADGDEVSWGVSCYHYGRWYSDANVGWCWIPGTTWAPAWVAWRSGGGYSGWCALPPQCGIGVNLSIGLVDRYCPANRFVFCDTRYLGEVNLHDHFVRNDVTIINRTTNITNITYVNNRIVNRGVTAEVVERAGGHIQHVDVQRATSIEDARRLRAEGKPVEYAPAQIEHADQRLAPRYQQAMAHQRAVDRSNVEKTDHAQAHERAVERTDAQKQADTAAHERAVDRTDVQKEDKTQAHERAVDRSDVQKEDKTQAHDRAVDRSDAQKDDKTAAHERAVERTNADKKPAVEERKPADSEKRPAVEEQKKPEKKPEPDKKPE